jgi:hypothetical membrane protein
VARWAYGGRMRGVSWWGVLPAAGAPVLLIGGWTVAASLQPGSFSQLADTISALAAHGATDRWVMTAAFLGLGACYALTALALRPAAAAGRLCLTAGGIATVLVAANPETAGHGGSLPHTLSAAAGFTALTLWPVLARQRGPSVPALLRPAVCACATAVLAALLVWFVVELSTGGGLIGLTERLLAGSQALWPLAVVLACYRRPTARGPAASSPRPLSRPDPGA